MANGAGKFQQICPRCGREDRRPEGVCSRCWIEVNSGKPVQGEIPFKFAEGKPKKAAVAT